ncbi:hypothetical protein CK203_040247 [Vitis vinifera]|uniref:Uncharacterized protein n=1 Tax=Vitis vinifera TaxID=29760 RepID=A0A438HXC4_VITVI|nr:hypothetical protein CK203_040247 [Vitis vinifera]
MGRCTDDKPYAPFFWVSQEKAKSLRIPLHSSRREEVNEEGVEAQQTE